MKNLIFWELNEINFDYVFSYIKTGRLPNWERFINKYGYTETTSEQEYELLEPWIQWPTIRTGLEFGEHKIFRLGDIIDSNVSQHWEILEKKGFTVAALSPINASNKTYNSPFWIPDPWVDTKISGSKSYAKLSDAINQSVNDNSKESITLKTYITLFIYLIKSFRFTSFNSYITNLIGVLKKQHWSKAIIFEKLLSDVFIKLYKTHSPNFSVIFSNAGAHIQHHYFFNSEFYSGQEKNPNWYISKSKDPILEILELYDNFLADLMKFKNVRLIIATGLRQIPYQNKVYYWRLKNHERFLRMLGIKFLKVEPRMTRDFHVAFANSVLAKECYSTLKAIKTLKGDQIFETVEINGDKVFASLTYSKSINENFSIENNGKTYHNFENDVVFVAIKNGHHDPKGYYFDTSKKNMNSKIHVKKLFDVVIDHFESRVK